MFTASAAKSHRPSPHLGHIRQYSQVLTPRTQRSLIEQPYPTQTTSEEYGFRGTTSGPTYTASRCCAQSLLLYEIHKEIVFLGSHMYLDQYAHPRLHLQHLSLPSYHRADPVAIYKTYHTRDTHLPEGTYLGPIDWHLARRSNWALSPHAVDSPGPPRAFHGNGAPCTEPHFGECGVPDLGENLHSPTVTASVAKKKVRASRASCNIAS